MLLVSAGCLQPKYFGSIADFLNSHFSTQLLQAVAALTPGPKLLCTLCSLISPQLDGSRARDEARREGFVPTTSFGRDGDNAGPGHDTQRSPAPMSCAARGSGGNRFCGEGLMRSPLLLLEAWCSRGCFSHFLPHSSLPDSVLSFLKYLFPEASLPGAAVPLRGAELQPAGTGCVLPSERSRSPAAQTPKLYKR